MAEPGAIRLVLEGELDIATAPLLVAHIQRAERTRPALLLLDLGGVNFIDVAGLTAMLGAGRRARRAGRRVMVTAASAQIRRLFELTAIDQSLEVAAAEAGASTPA